MILVQGKAAPKVLRNKVFKLLDSAKYQPKEDEIIMLLVRIVGRPFDSVRIITDFYWYKHQLMYARVGVFETMRDLFNRNEKIYLLIDKCQKRKKMLEYELFICSKEFREINHSNLRDGSVVPASDLICHSKKHFWKKTIWRKRCAHCGYPIQTINEGANEEDATAQPTCSSWCKEQLYFEYDNSKEALQRKIESYGFRLQYDYDFARALIAIDLIESRENNRSFNYGI